MIESKPTRNLALELVRVTEAAALAAGRSEEVVVVVAEAVEEEEERYFSAPMKVPLINASKLAPCITSAGRAWVGRPAAPAPVPGTERCGGGRLNRN